MSETPAAIPRPEPHTAGAGRVAGALRRALQWIPSKARMAVCFGLLVLIPLAIYSYLSTGQGDLNLVCHHNLQSAELTVSVDGELAFSDQISGTVKKRFGFLDKKVEGTLSRALSIPLGKHMVRVNVKSAPERFEQSRQIAVNLVSGREATVSITAQRGDLSLSYEGAPVSDQVGSPASSGSIWSVLVTVIGSVASASIGFMVQEFLHYRKAAFLQSQSSKLIR